MLNVDSRKILIVGNCIFRRGVASIVRDVVPRAFIAEAFCFAAARTLLGHDEFFAALFDIDTDEFNGHSGLRKLRVECPDIILGVLSRSASSGKILSYLAAGVTGFIVHSSDLIEVERGVRETLNRAIYIPPGFMEPATCVPEDAAASYQSSHRLTPRQNEVLELLLKEYTNKEIARQLKLSPHTVKIHVSALLRCFAVQKRSSLAVASATIRPEEISPRSPRAPLPMLQLSA